AAFASEMPAPIVASAISVAKTALDILWSPRRMQSQIALITGGPQIVNRQHRPYRTLFSVQH
ncbi:MAG: hypothetical protein WBW73_23600, partial [Rhodoplanes sp.]